MRLKNIKHNSFFQQCGWKNISLNNGLQESEMMKM
jgi:hypothetical protein